MNQPARPEAKVHRAVPADGPSVPPDAAPQADAGPPWPIDDAPFGLIRVSDAGRVLQVNRLVCDWVERPRQAIVGQPIDLLFPPASRLLFHTYLMPLLKLHGQVNELGLPLLSARGERRDTLVSANRAADTGELRMALAPMLERRRLEEQLRSTQRLANLVPGLLFEAHFPHRGRPTLPYATDALGSLYGVSPRRARRDARPVWAAIHPEDRAGLGDAIAAAAEAMAPLRRQYRVQVGGRLLWLETHATPTHDPAGGLRWHGYTSDITERRLLEAQATERDAAERANHAKSDFLARVSHELRTPLNGILGFSQLLLGPGGVRDARHRSQLGHIEQAGRSLLNVVDEVLDITRIERDELQLKIEPVDALAAGGDALALLQPLADLRRVRCRVEARGAAWCLADRQRLQQCLLNLLSNAVKYGPEGGQVTLRLQPQAPWLLIHVHDEGPGFTDDQHAHLFEPFNRLGAERSQVQGTGLGLLITRKLADAMGGHLQVLRDAPGGCIELRLPACAAPASVAPQAATPPWAGTPMTEGPPAGSLRVLYVEDNEVNCLLMAALLQLRPQCELAIVGSAQAAFDEVERTPPDLLLLDLNLPDLDGLSLLQALRTRPELARVPAVAVSADAIPQHIERHLAAGFDAYWTKPLVLSEVLPALDGFIARICAADAVDGPAEPAA